MDIICITIWTSSPVAAQAGSQCDDLCEYKLVDLVDPEGVVAPLYISFKQ
jgi:hypothetical protein